MSGVSRHPASPLADPWTVHLALASAQAGFALFPVLGKLALTTIPPVVMAALRVVAAALLLESVRRARARRAPAGPPNQQTQGWAPDGPPKPRAANEVLAPADRRRVLLYALLGVSFNQVLFILGLSMTTAINTTILTATIPVFTLMVAVLLGREEMTARAAASTLLAGAGAFALLNVESFDWHSRYFRGNLLLIANSLSYSFYLVLSRPILARYNVLTIVSRIFLYGAVPIVLFAAPALAGFVPGAVTLLSWACLLAVVLLCTVLPYLLNSWALARTEASRVAFYVFLQPVIASALAILILKESLNPKTLFAALLIFAGLAVSVVRGRLPARPIP